MGFFFSTRRKLHTMSAERNTIDLGDRYFKLARAGSIKNWLDAVVELVTNADDASKKSASRDICITIDPSATLLRVADHGTGMTFASMQENLLNVGNRSKSEENVHKRGFFRRGARDVTAIGNVTFDSCRDGKWSQITINSDLTYIVGAEDAAMDESVPEFVREWHAKSPDNTSTVVTLQLMPIHKVDLSAPECAEQITTLFQLRFLLADTERSISLKYMDKENVLLRYHFPEAVEVFPTKFYSVPGYSNITAKFQLFMASAPIPVAKQHRSMQSGILVRSEHSNYDVTYFDSRLQFDRANSQYFYGFLTTDGVHEMLADYDEHGPTTANPMLIVDPGRGHGINVDHPFIRALYSIPQVYLRMAIEERSKTTEYKYIDLNDVLLELKGLEIAASRFVRAESPLLFQYANYLSTLALAVHDIDSQYTITNIVSYPDVDVKIKKVKKVEDSKIEIPVFSSVEDLMQKNKNVLKSLYGEQIHDESLADAEIMVKESPSVTVKIVFEENSAQMEREFRIVYSISNLLIKINLCNTTVAQFYRFKQDDGQTSLEVEPVSDKSAFFLKMLVIDAVSWMCVTEDKHSSEAQIPGSVMENFFTSKHRVRIAFE